MYVCRVCTAAAGWAAAGELRASTAAAAQQAVVAAAAAAAHAGPAHGVPVPFSPAAAADSSRHTRTRFVASLRAAPCAMHAFSAFPSCVHPTHCWNGLRGDVMQVSALVQLQIGQPLPQSQGIQHLQPWA